MNEKTIQAAGLLVIVCMAALIPSGCDNSVESEAVAPTITSQPPLEATVGVEYTYSVHADADPVATFKLDEAPSGMTIDSLTGLISWTPTTNSQFDSRVSVTAVNAGGSFSQEFVIQTAGLHISGWETSSLVAANIDPAAIRAVAADIAEGTFPQINSLLIVRHGDLVFEDYFNGSTRNSSENIYSAEKSIMSCLLGIAIDNGFIADENELLYPFFAEYDSFDNWSTYKELISLKHLVTMTAGFSLEGDDHDIWLNNIGPRDWIKFYLDLPVTTLPGSALNYESLCDRLVGHVIERQAQTPLPSFAAEYLFQPLGMAYYDWSAWDPVDNSMISSRLQLRAIDMAKFGQMYLDGGVWQDKRIVAEDWVARSTKVNLDYYGYNWWVRQWATPVGNVDVYYAFGNGGNAIYAFETLDMVVVFSGDYFVQPDVWDQQWDLLKNRIIPALSG